MITGEVLALDGSAFAGSVVVTPLADGPSIVLAEQMAVVDAACSTSTSIRVTWNGGVNPDPPAQSYQVLLGDGRTLNAESLTDLGDNDNHHVLCVPSNPDDLLVTVTFPAGLVQDPNNDEFNLAQNISVTHPPVADYSKQFTYSALADTSSVSVGRESSPTQCDGCMCSCTIELSGGLVTATIVPSKKLHTVYWRFRLWVWLRVRLGLIPEDVAHPGRECKRGCHSRWEVQRPCGSHLGLRHRHCTV
jgi:hypothetical protein